MADAAVEKKSTPEPVREAMPPAQGQPEPKQGGRAAVEHGGIYASFKEIAASSAGQEPPPEKFFPIFRKAELSHPVNDAQKARVLGALQAEYGNRYVQRVLAPGADSKLAETNPPMQIFRHEDEGSGAHASSTASSVTPQIEQSHGQGLSSDTKQFMESRFGHDFNGVSVHDDSHAHEAARSLSAEAFTTGRDIYFSQGAYQPSTPSGQGLLAHELAHVVQQDNGAASRSTYGFHVSEPGDELEQQADAASHAVMRGEMFPPLTSSAVPVVARQASRNAGAPQGGGTTTGGQVGGGAPARAGDFPITIAGTTVVLPTAALIDRAMPGGRLPVPSNYLKYLSIPGFRATGAGLDFDENKAIKGASVDLEVKIEMLQGTGTLSVDKNGNASGTAHLTFSSKRTPGIKETTIDAAISKEDFKVDASLEYDLPHVTGTLSYKYENKHHSGRGTAKYEGSKLKGDIEIVLSEAGKISGSGKLEMELFKGLRGEVDVAVDEKRDIQVKGKLSVPGEIELFPEKKIEKSFFSFEKKFPLWGITIPVIDVNVGLFAEVHAGAGFRAKFGPGVLREIALTGEFGTDPEAATEFGLGGEFFVPAGAEIVINAGGGIGLGLAIADITGGVEAVGVAGVYTALSVRPQFQYAGGKYSISGVAELMGVAQAKFSINAFAKIDVGVWMFKGTVWRKDWTLAEWAWNAPLPINLRATINYTLGDEFAPEINFETPEVDPEKLIKDVMPESGSPVPAPPKPAVPEKGGFSAGDAQGKQAEGAGQQGPTPQAAGSPSAKTEAGQTDPGKDKTGPAKQGSGPPKKGKPGDQPDPEKKDGDVPPSDPEAKSAAVKGKVRDALAASGKGGFTTYEEVDALLTSIFNKYRPEGLKSLSIVGERENLGHFQVYAEASAKDVVGQLLSDHVGPAPEDIELKLSAFSGETHISLQLPDGSFYSGEIANIPGADVHAEEIFLYKVFPKLLPKYPATPGQPVPVFKLFINRTPCPKCTRLLSQTQATGGDRFQLVIAASNLYQKTKYENAYDEQGNIIVRRYSDPITKLHHLQQLVDSCLELEVWNIWDEIKAHYTDPRLGSLDMDLINDNVRERAKLENMLKAVNNKMKAKKLGRIKKG